MEDSNKNNFNIPSWMDTQFFQNLLMKSENCADIKITQIQISPATEAGTNFASTIFRAAIQFIIKSKETEISLIIKTVSTEDETKMEAVKQIPLFEIESAMYEEVITKFHSILRECGDDTVLGPRMLYNSSEPYRAIVLEDMQRQGFKMLESGLPSFEHLPIILNKICKWHAISFKLLHENNTIFNKFNRGVFNFEKDGALQQLCSSTFKCFTETISVLPNGEIYVEKFKNIHDKLLAKCNQMTRNIGDWCVLNHGDFHIKNIMFKFEDNSEKLKDILPVDFQFCVVAPFVIDLIYLLYTVVDNSGRFNRDVIISMYHQKLMDTLNMLKFKGRVPSLDDIHAEMLKHKYFGIRRFECYTSWNINLTIFTELTMIAVFLPLSCRIVTNGDFQPNEYMKSENTRKTCFKNPLYIHTLEIILPNLFSKGYFDE